MGSRKDRKEGSRKDRKEVSRGGREIQLRIKNYELRQLVHAKHAKDY